MEYKTILVEKKNGIAKIILNRPQTMNALTEELLGELVSALEDADKDSNIGVVILTGAGRAFSAGRDLPGILEGREFPGGERYRKLEDLGKPVIVAVKGPCYTGSFELAMCADIIIASEDAIFCDTHARFGIIPGGGQTQRLPRQIGVKKAKELIFTCDTIPAGDAERLGIVNKVVPLDMLDNAAEEMAEKILKNVPEAIITIKKLINEGMNMDQASGLKMEAGIHGERPITPRGDGMKRISSLLKKK